MRWKNSGTGQKISHIGNIKKKRSVLNWVTQAEMRDWEKDLELLN